MKMAGFAVFFLAALGAMGMGVSSAPGHGTPEAYKLPPLAFRALPATAVTVGTPAAAPPSKPAEPAAPVAVAAPPEPVKPEPARPEPVKPEPAKPAPVAVAPTPKPAPAARPAPAAPAEPVAARPPPAPAQPKPAAAPKPEAAAAAGGEGTAPAPTASASASTEGTINLKASDTAEVVIDGRKAGPSPRLGVKLKAGKHKVRFDCYDENGNLKAGKVQTVEVLPDGEQDIDYECPANE